MINSVLVFAGTNEGREICNFLCEKNIPTTACVATDYGSFCLENIENLTVLEGRLSLVEIENLIQSYDYVVDASHPYATVISENILKACKDETKLIRIVRDTQAEKGEIFDDFPSLCEFLNTNDENVLLTTGSKDLHYFKSVNNFESRVFPRVLPAVESLENALNLGFKASNIMCMQGPFSVEMNLAILEKTKAKYIVSKDTGKSGGFPEKVKAAQMTGAKLLTVGRPVKETGLSLDETKRFFQKIINESKVKSKVFPSFLNIENKTVLVVGAGKIATRRINTLSNFKLNIKVVAPNISSEIEEIANYCIKDSFKDEYINGCDIVVACTNDKEVNEHIYNICKEKNIMVNVCENEKLCDFYFPAIFQNDEIIGAVVSKEGNKHSLVKETAEKLRGML